jgi:NAD(P)-dependent dehydrogenase (short-subunit alcohol dehydrogenase family)
MYSLTNKTALITGASRGIGRATAKALAGLGARVFIHYGNSLDAAKELAGEIQNSGGHATVIGADLAKPDGPSDLAAKVRELLAEGRLDILVSNAGISKAASIEAHTIEDFDELVATNVRAPFFLLQQLLPVLGEGSSVIVTTSVVARFVPGDAGAPGSPTLPVYAATKGALETFVKHWAAVLGTRGIRVNAVAPGVIETDMSNFTRSAAGRELTLKMQALKRIGQADDVADVIAFLASDASRWITGASIPVDGGSKL